VVMRKREMRLSPERTNIYISIEAQRNSVAGRAMILSDCWSSDSLFILAGFWVLA
jgi:hypothetical protein